MDKELVPYDPALELKELGFDEPCFGLFTIDKTLLEKVTWMPNQTECETYFGGILAPLYQQAFRWFREKHELVHHINRDGGWWLCSILDLYDEEDQGAIETHIDNCYPDTYEEAELACLKKLIEIVKNR